MEQAKQRLLQAVMATAPVASAAPINQLKQWPPQQPASPKPAGSATHTAAAAATQAVSSPVATQSAVPLLSNIKRAERSVFATAAFRAGSGPAPAPANNFLKGVKFSPDGLCLLTNSEDHALRLFELPAIDTLYAAAKHKLSTHPSDSKLSSGGGGAAAASASAMSELSAILTSSEGDTIYDFCWNPRMNSNSSDRSECYFISTSRDKPIHLWDAFDGTLRSSYVAYNTVDEPTAALAVAISAAGTGASASVTGSGSSSGAAGTLIYGGYNNCIRVWDVTRPGRDYTERSTISTGRRSNKSRSAAANQYANVAEQRGLLSCIDVSRDGAYYAVGSYSGTACVYASDTGEIVTHLECHPNGVTAVKFSPDGMFLFTAGRKDDEILGWDIRNTCSVLGRFPRACGNNQRIAFDVDPMTGRFLITGSQTVSSTGSISAGSGGSGGGKVLVYDLLSSPDEHTQRFAPSHAWPATTAAAATNQPEAINGVSFHPHFSEQYPILATTSGTRRFPPAADMNSDSDADSGTDMKAAPSQATPAAAAKATSAGASATAMTDTRTSSAGSSLETDNTLAVWLLFDK